MSVILARPHAATGAPPDVHAWHVPVDAAGLYVTACGKVAKGDDLEQVERFTGAPCVVCLLLATGAADRDELPANGRAALAVEPAPVESEPVETEPVVIVVDGPAEVPTGGTYRYGVAMRGERHAHLVEPDAVRGRLDGREVVQTLCCALAWGPLAEPPYEWPVCAECAEIAAAVRA